MEYRYGNLKNLAQLKSAVNENGITDTIPPKNQNSMYFGNQASLLRNKMFPSLTPESSPDKQGKKEENLSSEIVETGFQHGAINALGEGLGFNTSILAFALEFALKVNEAYHEMKLDKVLAMENQDVNIGHSVKPSFTDLKSRIKIIKSEIEEDENSNYKKKKKFSNSIRYGRHSKYRPH